MSNDMEYRIVTDGDGFIASDIDGTVQVYGTEFSETVAKLRDILQDMSGIVTAI